MRRLAILLLALTGPTSIPSASAAEELPTFKLTLKDGTLVPARIVAPAGKRFKIELTNAGKSPAEFESISLRREKVLGVGVTSFVVVNATKPGEHDFFDDFHPQNKGVIVVR